MPGCVRGWGLGCVASLVAAAMQVASVAAAELKPWRHGVITAKGDAGFAWMVRDGGFAEKQGLKLDMPALQDDTLLLKALVAGELDSIQVGPGVAVIAASRGIDVKIVGCSWPGLAHAVYSQGSIKSVADLRGKSVGIASPASLPDLLARAWFENNKIPMSEVKLVSLGSDPDRFKALLAGVVDASIASVEFGKDAAEHGLNLLITGSDIEPRFLRLCETTTGKVIAERGDDLVRFLAADIQAHRYALANRDAEIDVARKVLKVGPEDERAPFMYDFVQRTHAIDPDLSLPQEKFAFMQDLLVKVGSITQPGDLKKLLASDLHARALALAGK